MTGTEGRAGRVVEAADIPWFARRHRLALAAVVLLGLALRLYRLDAQGVWFDEAFTVAHSVEPLDALWRTLWIDGLHPPLHYWILHVWFDIAGFGAWQARLLSVVFGTLSIPLLYLLARRFTDTATSLVAALLLSVSQIAVYFSQEARSYSAAQCASLLAAVAFMRLLERPTIGRTAAVAAASLALLATHYYGVATLAALGLFWVLFRRHHSALVFRRLVVAAAAVAAAYVPWPLALRSSPASGPAAVFQARDPSERPSLLSPVMALNRFNNGKFASIEAGSPVTSVALGLGLFTLPIVAGLWLARPGRRPRAAAQRAPAVGADGDATQARRLQWRGLVLGCLLAACPVGVAILLGLFGAVFNYRHFSFAVAGYYLAVTIGSQVTLDRRRLRTAWLAVVVGLSLVSLRANYFAPTKPDYRAALAPLAAAYRPGDCAVTRPGIWNDTMHLAWPVYYRDLGSPTVIPFDSLPSGSAGCERVWVIWDTTWWMNRNDVERARTTQMVTALEPTFALVERHAHPDVELRLFRRQLSR